MQLLTEAALILGVVAAGVPLEGIIARSGPDTEPVTASVRFVNNLSTSASLTANGQRIFESVPAGTVTEYVQVTDSTVAFALEVPDMPNDTARASQVVVDGARYTVTARRRMEGKAELEVVREEKPDTAHAGW